MKNLASEFNPQVLAAGNKVFTKAREVQLLKNDNHGSGAERILVLLATHNGAQWIEEQVDSICTQIGVEVSILASDDASTDGTYEYLSSSSKVRLLPGRGPYGSAGKNFFHLLSQADFSKCDFIAFADQDDIWHDCKLKRAIDCMNREGCGGYSANVTAFWEDGRESLVIKSQAQKEFDYLFEGAGPGSTYVMSMKLAKRLQDIFRANPRISEEISLHDWYAYAVARSNGFTWFIDKESMVRYRQHGANELGANIGYKAAIARFKKIKSCWYRSQVEAISRVSGADSHALVRKILRNTWSGRICLVLHASKFRRRYRDALALSIISLIGWF